jgi:hypothetical protein
MGADGKIAQHRGPVAAETAISSKRLASQKQGRARDRHQGNVGLTSI